MKYCVNCLQPDTRPNIKFDERNICPACSYFEKLPLVDWLERADIAEELASLSRAANKRKNCGWDCIIGVSGGKDSLRQALFVRDKLKLNPLLVSVSYPPDMVTYLGVHNVSNMISLGFDCQIVYPAPETFKELMKLGFDLYGNFAKATELTLFSAVPQLAIEYGISTIFWGENPGLQLGDLKTLGSTGYDGNNLRDMNTLGGGDLSWITDRRPDNFDLIPYQYPPRVHFDDAGIQIIYLGWFLGDWSLVNNASYSLLDGVDVRESAPDKTGDPWGVTALDDDWVMVNQMIKYYKFGFGRASDYVNEEIRLGRMSRGEGISMVQKYDGVCDRKYIQSFCKFLDISEAYFWSKVHSMVDLRLFEISESGKITPKFSVGEGI